MKSPIEPTTMKAPLYRDWADFDIRWSHGAWVKNWIRLSEDAPILWSQGGSEYHFEAKVNGLQIASYYKCDEPKGCWHKGFKVYFGNTYFDCDLPDVSAAKEAIAETWKLWISRAKSICPPSVKSVAKKSITKRKVSE